MSRVVLTKHAVHRAQQMGVERDEIERCVLDPELTYAQGNYGSDQWIHRRGRLAVAVSHGRRHHLVVITVLWNTRGKYTRPDVGLVPDRS